MSRVRVLGVLVVVAVALAACGAWATWGTVRVLDARPNGGAAVPVTASIRIAFSRPMDPASVKAHLHVEPETRGEIYAVGREIVYRPAGGLVPGTTYTVTLDAGAASTSGRLLARGRSWKWTTRPPALLYLAWEPAATQETGVDRTPGQIHVVTLDGRPPHALTAVPGGVWDFAVDPLGERVVYSAVREDEGTDLWLLTLTPEREVERTRRLLACPDAACLAPAWSADGRWIAFERRDLLADGPNLDSSAGRIWLLEVEEGREQALFDYDVPLHTPVWSPVVPPDVGDGGRPGVGGLGSTHLAYVSPLVPAVEVMDLESGEIGPVPNEWGTAPTWSPDGRHLVVPDLALLEEPEALVVHLFEVDVGEAAGGEPPTNLTALAGSAAGGPLLVQDTGPAWSPAGGWIAFSRRSFEGEQWTPGRQVWLMRPAGAAGEAYVLIREPLNDLFGLVWRPDGGALAFLSTDLSEGPQAQPRVEVRVFDFETRQSIVVGEGVLARWLP